MTVPPRLAVVGNPANRRVAMFREAARAAGFPDPRVYAWSDVLRSALALRAPRAGGAAGAGPARAGRGLPGPGTLVRVDSPGEDAGVDVLLRALGSGRAPARLRAAETGEILGVREAHLGLGVALRHLADAGGTLLNPPDDVLTMSDKPRCHAVLEGAGIPVPEALPPIGGGDELVAAMRAKRWGRVFVKPAHGSSASGVLALTVAGGERVRVSAVTSTELAADGRLFNNLRLRRYDSVAEVTAVVDRLAPGGLHVERWYPRAGIGGRVFDLRVVVTAGEPRHAVVRTSRGPLTNLHLGNARGDLGAVREALGERGWAAAMRTCERVAGCFPGSLHAGVDLMIGAGFRGHAVAEVNAFGDLLPRVLSDGRDTYGQQLAALANGRWAAWTGAACAT